MTDYEKGLKKIFGFDPVEYSDTPDLRTDPAFAWRVLEALYSSPLDGAQDIWGEFWYLAIESSLLDALYGAVEALGRES